MIPLRAFLPLLAALLAAPLASAGARADAADPSTAAEPEVLPRVVSLNPSLTAILVALGAQASLVGVDDWSARDLASVRGLPRVGGLFNPSLESILALEPDLVVLVPSAQQRDLRRRLEDLDVAVLALPNITLEQVLASIETLGARVGHAEAARERVREIREAWSEAERVAASRASRPRAVLVLQRDPLYVVGGGSFLDAMLRAAGAENLAAAFDEPYPRVGVEWLIAAAPDLILDAAPAPEKGAAHWARWPSLPAVAGGRVVMVPADTVAFPGPHLDRGLRWLAAAVRGEALPEDTP